MRPVYDEKVCIVHEDVSRILFSEQDLSNRVAEMGSAITRDYADATREEGLILISVLRGAAIFMADLAREIKLPLEMDYMAISSLEVATLLRKKTPDQADVKCRYVGFECPDEFIVGYGLDYAERYRNLPYIGVLKPELYQ